MNLQVHFNPEVEHLLRMRAAALGKDVSSLVEDLVVEQLSAEEPPAAPDSSTPFAERLASWVRLHPVLDHAVDDSRDSIYSGRGE